MAINNQDKTEIHNLPEVTTLQPGMMVAVDSEPTGTKSFNLTAALEGTASADDISALENELAEKVDAPANTPAEGQVLTFNGSANTWANAPEGVYMLKYSEVTNLDDVDLDQATTIPTFILIDADQTLTIGNSTSSDTISIKSGTIMRLEEVGGNDNGKPMFLTFVTDYGKSSTGGTYMTYGNYFVRLVVSKSMYGGVSKQFGVSADIWDSNLFRSQQIPVVKKYDNARGPAESSGNLNGDANSLIVSFEDAGSNKRRQLLPPAELASHDFSSDTTPEQIQFMGWGATSNRAGYKNLITAQHTYDSTNFPQQTPQVQFSKAKMSGGTPGSDQVMDIVQASMKSSDGQSTTTIGGILVPSISSAGVLQNWSDSNGGHYGWKPVNEVPASTSSNAGQVLTVDSNGTPGWAKDNTAIVLIDQTQSASVRAAQFADIIAQGKKPAIIYSCDVAPSQSLSFFAIYQYDNASNQHIFTGTSLLDDTNYHVMPRIYTIIVSISSDFLSSGASTFENGSLCYDYLSGDAPSTEITVKNNTLTEVSSSITNNISTLTITIESVYQRKANAAIELNPINSDLTLTVKFGSSTLRHSVSAGTTLTAGKLYQVTAVGNCWTLAEFEA